MLWTIRVTYRTAAGAIREETLEVDRETYAEAEEACTRVVLRQPGREIVGVEVEDPDE